VYSTGNGIEVAVQVYHNCYQTVIQWNDWQSHSHSEPFNAMDPNSLGVVFGIATRADSYTEYVNILY